MLGEFLKARCGARGPWNCSTMPADWCVALGHPDFAADWRDVVDPGECCAVPAEAGGLIALWDRGIGDGLRVVDDPDAGDIAVVEAMGIEAGAIFTGERWAIEGPRGLHFLAPGQLRVVKVWRP